MWTLFNLLTFLPFIHKLYKITYLIQELYSPLFMNIYELERKGWITSNFDRSYNFSIDLVANGIPSNETVSFQYIVSIDFATDEIPLLIISLTH